MKVLIIGAHGNVGKRISKKMSASKEFEPTAFIRKPEQRSYFEDMGVATVVESLENTPEAIGEVIKDYDAVVFSAGSGGKTGDDKTIEIDLDGAIKSINQADKHNVKRFVMVGASHTDDRSYWGKVDGMKPYYTAKHYADMELKRSNLDYTILRPVALTDDEEAGKVTMAKSPDGVATEIPREAVAETVLAVLNNPKSVGKIIEMSKGDHEITEALDQFLA
ncbi:NAD(P)-binding oxidoreductase [Zunongwangia endophytica]|uniref:NAD(P)-binding oxidoreductase n=1 Tax=Zunongwangia endophytica TaxID=1808945 RepID=A0ABV8H6M8_9FLAO|nr:NAD(P)-binding oxidoreductase [Zunongwangia endophytica]MDN3594796.1 SDR family oxidoreductase [Zunongwangia endophytica]